MKKTILLALLIGVIYTISSFAQADKSGLTTQQKMLPFGVGMALSVQGEMHDDNFAAALADFQEDIPAYSAALRPVVALKKDAAEYVRLDVAQTATEKLRSSAGATEKWLLLVGERFGVIYVEMTKAKRAGKLPSAEELKFSLGVIEILTGSAPKDVPAEIVEMIEKIAEMKDIENLNSNQNTVKIADQVMEILAAMGA